MRKGALALVLHSHLPYARASGRWPHGEEWVHEAATGTYLPLLKALRELTDEGVRFELTIGLTPVLLEQLADPLILDNLLVYLQEKVERAHADIERFERQGDAARADLALWHQRRYSKLLSFFDQDLDRDIVGAFRRLQDNGYIEIATSAATHGYLPLLERDSSIYAQVAVGVATYRRHFARNPTAFWLPECAYRPAFQQEPEDGAIRPGLEEFLAAQGIRVFFVETHTIEGGSPVGKAVGDALGLYGEIPKRHVLAPADPSESTLKTTFLPYFVGTSPAAAIGRNNRTGLQVWSASHGYPGDFAYREFHKRDDVSGMHYWRVTGSETDLGSKDLYDPHQADERVREHSAHFARLVDELAGDFNEATGRYGLVAAIYDTELFGHWWHEGVDWLKQVLRYLSKSETVELTTASRYIEEHPPAEALLLSEGSWGQGGNHFTWLNHETEWMWPIIHAAERRMESLVSVHGEVEGPFQALLSQAARELLLLQSSDWPFLITTGQADDYATNRFRQHAHRFERLADAIEARDADGDTLAFCKELYEADKVFPDIDHRLFAEREGKAS